MQKLVDGIHRFPLGMLGPNELVIAGTHDNKVVSSILLKKYTKMRDAIRRCILFVDEGTRYSSYRH